jgi:hypothetical protein
MYELTHACFVFSVRLLGKQGSQKEAEVNQWSPRQTKHLSDKPHHTHNYWEYLHNEKKACEGMGGTISTTAATSRQNENEYSDGWNYNGNRHIGGTTTTDWRSDLLHFYLTTLQFKNFNIPCMHKVCAPRGQFAWVYNQGPTLKGGANLLAPVSMFDRRAFISFMILLFVYLHILVTVLCFFWESSGRQDHYKGICMGSWNL